jgi:hypothetical protein
VTRRALSAGARLSFDCAFHRLMLGRGGGDATLTPLYGADGTVNPLGDRHALRNGEYVIDLSDLRCPDGGNECEDTWRVWVHE